MSKYYYLDISLKILYIEDSSDVSFTPELIKQHILDKVRLFFGPIEQEKICLLRFDADTLHSILRVPKEHYVKLRAALTLEYSYLGKPAQFIVHKASPLLLSLQGDSRSFTHS